MTEQTNNSNEKVTLAPIQPFILVIFGITGDLARRKVLPALYHLFKDGLLPDNIHIIGTSRQNLSNKQFLNEIELCVLEADHQCDPEVLKTFENKTEIIQFDPTNNQDYLKLTTLLDQIESKYNLTMNRLFYLSIPPAVYSLLVNKLGQHNIGKNPRSRLLVEKPFGSDSKSANELINITSKHFKENQVYRIDHYLAKESAQNILTFRKYNPLFYDIWNNKHINDIQVIASESIGIEGRVHFYEQVGALRDLIQSHLMQLMALTTIELPDNINDANEIHKAKKNLLDSIMPPTIEAIKKTAIRGQYIGYRQEVNNPLSTVETYASIKLEINNKRWQGIPITITTGKALSTKKTEIIITFKSKHITGINKLTFRIQPNDGIDIELLVKKPGFEQSLETAKMNFSYHDSFDKLVHPDAYERVLIDAARGDNMLFATSEEVLISWRILDPITSYWQQNDQDLKFYTPGDTL